MSRVAERIVVTKDDIKKLNDIVNDNSFNSKELVTRCKAIILAGEGLKNKEISERLGVRQNSVGDWRKAWIAGGIDAITGIAKTGRPRGDKRKTLDSVLNGEDSIKTGTESAKAYSEQSGASVATVYRAIAESKGKGTAFRGSNDIPVSLATTPRIVDIAGMYVSGTEAAIIIRVCNDECEHALDHGHMILYSKAAEEYIKEASDPEGMVTLTNALDILAEHSGEMKAKGRQNTLREFLSKIIPAIPGAAQNEYTVVYYSEDRSATEKAVNRRNMRTTAVSDFGTWVKETVFWICLLTSDMDLANGIGERIKKYMDVRKTGTDIFQWYRCDLAIDGEDTSEEKDPFSNPEVENIVTITATIENRDGSSTTAKVTGSNIVPTASAFDYSDAVSFGDTVDMIDRGFGGLFQKARRELMQGYMNDALKKTV